MVRIHNMTTVERNRLAQFLLVNNKKGRVVRGKVEEAIQAFGVSRRTVEYTWSMAKKQVHEGNHVTIEHGQLGIPKAKQLVLDKELFKSIPWEKRGTIRRLARELGVSKSQLHRWIKDGVIKAHTNAMKPQLNPMNKLQRLQFALSSLVPINNEHKFKFASMHNTVHIEEKWFFMSRASERGYKLDEEIGPHRSCQNKRDITNVMFMCAVARPIIGENQQVLFDGKIGIFPFTYQEPAKRKSKNRLKGTIVTKPIESITKLVTKDCLINKIIPAIKAKWPVNASKRIIIQQDNAKPHICNNDPEFRAAASSEGFDIILACQPPNSPDTNINDLGWFRVIIQSLQVDTASYSIDELIINVHRSFDELTDISLNNVFLSLQQCLIEILKVKGGNNYKVPHMGKQRLIRQELLPDNVEAEEELVRETIEYLIQAGQVKGINYDYGEIMNVLGYEGL